MNDKKQKLLETLDAFVNQRPGMDSRDYGYGLDGWRAYRRESASVTRDMHDYYAIRNHMAWRDSISADDIIEASKHAFSGRLEIKDISAHYDDGSIYWNFSIHYCAGLYAPTEYRKAACAVLASAWWNSTRQDCPDFPVDDTGNFTGNNPGQWMRDTAKREFGRALQGKYFG